MPTSFDAAYAEALASAPPAALILHTLEFRHPVFTTPLRVVQDYAPLHAGLEADAPVDGGAMVDFLAYPFDVKLPDVDTAGKPQIEITIDNVSREIVQALEDAVGSRELIEVTYRAYLQSDPSGPQNDPPLTMVIESATATLGTVTARASLPNFAQRRHPSEQYTDVRFPGLVQ